MDLSHALAEAVADSDLMGDGLALPNIYVILASICRIEGEG